jgi:hypothetical protein
MGVGGALWRNCVADTLFRPCQTLWSVRMQTGGLVGLGLVCWVWTRMQTGANRIVFLGTPSRIYYFNYACEEPPAIPRVDARWGYVYLVCNRSIKMLNNDSQALQLFHVKHFIRLKYYRPPPQTLQSPYNHHKPNSPPPLGVPRF